MRLTKFEHASLLVEESGAKLFIDPGSFTAPIAEPDGAVAIVVTHEHADHWTPEQIRRIRDAEPDVRIFGPRGVADAAAEFPVTVVSAGEVVTAGPFTLRFFGGQHAVIHRSIPVVDNLGVLVNDTLYYGGDSLLVPEGLTVDTLAAPAGGPWLKISDVMDYVLDVAPRRSFPVHEMVLSRAGKELSNARIEWATRQGGGEFFALEPGDTLEL